jgi:hypothetical protein
MLPPAEQLAYDLKLLRKRKYRTKKAMAVIMAQYLGRSFESFYPYFTRYTTGEKLSKKFYTNFYKLFQADLKVIELTDNAIPQSDDEISKQIAGQFEELIKSNADERTEKMLARFEMLIKNLQYLIKINQKVVVMQAEILSLLNERKTEF